MVSREPIRTATGVGRTFQLPSGAAGKILVAWSAERLAMTAKRSPQNGKKLASEPSLVVDRGHALSDGETITGARGLNSSSAEAC